MLRSLSTIALIDGFERYLQDLSNAFRAFAIEVSLFSIPNGKHLPVEAAKHARYKGACTHILTPPTALQQHDQLFEKHYW
jgi:hypothetical protein